MVLGALKIEDRALSGHHNSKCARTPLVLNASNSIHSLLLTEIHVAAAAQHPILRGFVIDNVVVYLEQQNFRGKARVSSSVVV